MTTTPLSSTHRLSQHVAEYELIDGRYAIWNPFFPNVTVLTQAGLAALKALPARQDAWPVSTLAELRDKRILYVGDEDPYEADFFSTADKHVARLDGDTDRFYDDGVPYGTLILVNSACNLGCSYCVSYYGDDARDDAKRDAVRGAAREAAVLQVVDQFINRARKGGQNQGMITFNGGEILLRWPTVRAVLEHVEAKHPDFKPEYSMNTNATLLTKEIADVLAKYNVDVAVSIDGYKELHDQSRVYHGGGESFDKVMTGINNYRDAAQKPFASFQGTIENIDDFDPEKFFAMAEHGFQSARLAPNLLDHHDPQRGRDAAFWESSLRLESLRRDMGLGKSHFDKAVKSASDDRLARGFRPNCGGLAGPGLMRSITVNMDSMQVSQLCSFSSPAAVPMTSVGNGIDDRAIWAATRKYITDRISMLKTACRGCSVIGVCQGGCVYNALDVHNKLIPAGCAYQRALWRHAIDFNHSGEIRQLPPSPEDAPAQAETDAGDHGCGAPAPLLSADGRKVWTLQPAG